MTARRTRARAVLRVLGDLVLPLALYYVLRAVGVSVYLTLLITAAVPAVFAGYRLVRQRRLDGLAVYMTVMVLLAAAVSLVAGDERFLLAKEAVATGVTGLWFGASVWARRPLTFLFSRPMLERRVKIGPPGLSWDELWELVPGFRRIWRVSSVLWAVALLADAVLRVIMAYTLPVDAVPALGTALYVGTSLAVMVITNIYYVIAGLFGDRSALYASITRNLETSTVD
ncbi:hypothetical protein F0L68_23870 [Solihabitans fulvus]|uniref:Intracellular septation protein A n=1 Tax=Solihabitans fulvus TaxID=1892852 RepID=A0A5B2X3Z8_9PSEU|nr:VC0807 family protein [Solihabitans fulvus]KAA2258027.1 hypothetical protein F0L68_23870 [Solihabitans fulvus]